MPLGSDEPTELAFSQDFSGIELRAFYDSLTTPQQRVLALRYEEYKLEDIAEIMGVTIDTVRGHLEKIQEKWQS